MQEQNGATEYKLQLEDQIGDAYSAVLIWARANAHCAILEADGERTSEAVLAHCAQCKKDALEVLEKNLMDDKEFPIGAATTLKMHWDKARSMVASDRREKAYGAIVYALALVQTLHPYARYNPDNFKFEGMDGVRTGVDMAGGKDQTVTTEPLEGGRSEPASSIHPSRKIYPPVG